MIDGENSQLTLEQRLQVLELLLEDVLLGGYLLQPELRGAVAQAIHVRLEASKPESCIPPGVAASLSRIANALFEIDNTPHQMQPALRDVLSFGGPAGALDRDAAKDE